MLIFDQIRLEQGRQHGLLAKILAVAAGLVLFGASLFLGVVFLFAAILFVAIVSVVARLKGAASASGRESGSTSRASVIEGEYVVVDSTDREKNIVGGR